MGHVGELFVVLLFLEGKEWVNAWEGTSLKDNLGVRTCRMRDALVC